MPATAYSGIGVRGIGWPDPGLLWQTAFGLRFGLFTSAPLLLLALYPPAWAREDLRLFGKPEALLALGLTVALFLFSAATSTAGCSSTAASGTWFRSLPSCSSSQPASRRPPA
jgi:hypothetical protein